MDVTKELGCANCLWMRAMDGEGEVESKWWCVAPVPMWVWELADEVKPELVERRLGDGVLMKKAVECESFDPRVEEG